MLTIINGLPDNTLGVFAEGKITGSDYESVLIPALKEKLKTHKKVRFLYHLGSSFTSFDLSAMLDDAKFGIQHFSAWEKIALVSDHEMINTFVKFFGFMTPGEIRIFKNDEIEEAKKWIIEV
ncbi:MAG: STAS/SEC14 domain-containing protein [Ignavibacteria bacterium]